MSETMQTQDSVRISALLNPAEAAKFLMTTVGTLAVWRSTRRYPLRFVRVGRKIFYRSEDVQLFIDLRTHSGVSEMHDSRGSRRKRSA
jgi:hypothetical protein